MGRIIDDCAKRRLTEKTDIETAMRFLVSRGCQLDDVTTQLARFYYIDIDALNEVLAAQAAPKPALAREPQQALQRRVA